MSHCRHSHHAQIKKADFWTKFATVGEGVASFASDGYWIGGLIDLAFNLDDDGLGLSWYGFGFGTGLSLLTAIGTAYAHNSLNLYHQPDAHDEHGAKAEDEDDIEHGHSHSHGHAHSHSEHGEEAHEAHAPVPVVNSTKELNERLALVPRNDGKLSKLQKASVVGDFISHTGDIAGPITFVANIIAKDRLPRWGSAIVHCGATLFAGVASYANARSCANSMRENNRRKEAANQAMVRTSM